MPMDDCSGRGQKRECGSRTEHVSSTLYRAFFVKRDGLKLRLVAVGTSGCEFIAAHPIASQKAVRTAAKVATEWRLMLAAENDLQAVAGIDAPTLLICGGYTRRPAQRVGRGASQDAVPCPPSRDCRRRPT
jgi:hypothetical protein